MHARFYAPAASATGQIVALPDDESAHLSRVLRLRPGDAVRAFDGRGHEFDAVVEQAAARAAHLRLGAVRTPAAERRVAVTLVQAVLKGDKMDDVVRDATMMGAVAIQPLLTTRSELSAATISRSGRQQRWERIAIASVKQCGRAVLPVVRPACTFSDLLTASAQEMLRAPVLVFVEPGASIECGRLQDVCATRPGDVTIVIGPEGGWTPDEIAGAADAFRLVTMRGPTLRADAMPLAALAALFARWEDL